jgi:hypothetical protein
MRTLAACTALCLALAAAPVSAAELEDQLQKLLAVGAEAKGHAAAKAAWMDLTKAARPDDLPVLLAALDDAEQLSANWVRAAVDAVAERAVKAKQPLPQKELEEFVFDTAHSPRGRRLAFEWLARVDDTAEDRIIPQMLNDPSVEFRRDAVQRLIDEAGTIDKDDKARLTEVYEKALSGARDQDQVELLAKSLGELGRPVDVPRHFGFIQQWKLIGPFDNVDKKGFPIAYPPEKELNFSAEYDGKAGKVRWLDHITYDNYGVVDLNKAIAKHMGAAAYGVTDFVSDQEQTVELRLSSICAVKLWLNGELVEAKEVYHANSEIDQYPVKATLKKGKNVILVKCLQNEQTEDWAQDWSFQLRICDSAGTAILSADRPAKFEKPEAETPQPEDAKQE